MNLIRPASTLIGKNNIIVTCLDWCIPENICLDASERFKARTLILVVSILLLLSIVSMALVISVDKVIPERRLVTISLISLQPVSIWLMRMSRSTKEASWYVISLLSLTVAYIDYNNQSFAGAFSILWMLPSTLGVMLLGGASGIKVAGISIVCMSTNFFFLKAGMLPEPITPSDKWLHVEFIVSILIMLLVTFCVVGLFSMARQRERELSFEIEARKRFARELEKAKNIAEGAAKNKSLFLATMSHELRTPLNSILGNAELLSKEGLKPLTEGRVKDIYSSGQLLISIINDVLDLSKMDSYGIELNKQSYDLSEQIKEIHRMMTPQVKPGVQFLLEGVDEPILIYTDPNRLAQVLLNLSSNALKFTEKGTVTVTVKKQGNRSIEVIIKDTGVGISKVDAEHLFEEFVQVRKHANRQVEGTGLGLSIVKRILDKMDGTIKLESVEGKGSIFTVIFPIKDAPLESIESSSNDNATKERVTMSQDLPNKRLLIVDDVSMNCIILKALLEAIGITQIEEESDGAMAVERIQQDKEFDAILMDVRMPKMDGLEASQLIRELGYDRPIIAVTANAFEEDRKACLEAGMNGFLSKPINMEKLQQSLNDIFEEGIKKPE